MIRNYFILLLYVSLLTQLFHTGDNLRRVGRKYEIKLNSVQHHSPWSERKPSSRNEFGFTSTTQRTPTHDWACVGISSGFSCGFCGMSLLCVGGKAYQQPCPPETSCSNRAEFSGPVCHTIIPNGCQCKGLNELLPDLYNPASYIICTSSSLTPQRIEMCPNEYYFNATTSTCQKVPLFPPCLTIGTFPYTTDCRWYYTCIIDASGNWKQIPAKCMVPGTVYSSFIKGCSDPYTLSSDDHCSSNAETPRSRYVCTLFGLIVSSILPSYVDTFCHKINR